MASSWVCRFRSVSVALVINIDLEIRAGILKLYAAGVTVGKIRW
jgi:hypothetical protein